MVKQSTSYECTYLKQSFALISVYVLEECYVSLEISQRCVYLASPNTQGHQKIKINMSVS
jgi:hypothetical protein